MIGISRDSRHKRRRSGAKRAIHQKKRKFEMARPPAGTKIGEPRVRPIRARGGNLKYRALRLDAGNFSWGSENCTRKTRIINVVYNATNNELVRTNTLVKNAVVSIDATPFRQFYEAHYGLELGSKASAKDGAAVTEVKKTTDKDIAQRQKDRVLDPAIEEQLIAGRLYACISSRPGQVGRCDGYIIEGKELEFYARKLQSKKKAGK